MKEYGANIAARVSYKTLAILDGIAKKANVKKSDAIRLALEEGLEMAAMLNGIRPSKLNWIKTKSDYLKFMRGIK